MSTRDYEEKIKRINAVYGCAYSFVSALTKQRLLKALEATVKVYENRQRIATSKFNEFMLKIEGISPANKRSM
jgi:GTP-binding protein